MAVADWHGAVTTARCETDGMLAKGYTLMGTGQHLWTLGEHYRLTRDASGCGTPPRRWCGPVAGSSANRKTSGSIHTARRSPSRGLPPPGVLADWNRYAYYFYANAHFCAGPDAADRLPGSSTRTAGSPAAAEYREDILRALHWHQARMPVVPLRDGTWVPPFPSSLYWLGLTSDFYQGISSIGHDVEVGGNHLVPLGLIHPESRDAAWIADNLEDRWFLIDGIFGAYPTAENEEDWFNRGGFAKLQPHYARTSDMHALRDDVKPFVRTYFNTFPILLNPENLTYWEHMNNGGAWNKTHESGWFLQMTRTMLVKERGELWLAPFVTNNWLKDGMSVAVRNAPTRFGKVTYQIALERSGRHIEAVIEPPTRGRPRSLVLRLRHPEGEAPGRAVTVDSRPHVDFDPAADTIPDRAASDDNQGGGRVLNLT